MTTEEITKELDLEGCAIFLEPAETFNQGIIGCTEDRQHLIYDRTKLIRALEIQAAADGEPEPYDCAVDWFEYNTARAIPYMPEEGRPILNITLQQE